VYRTFRDFPFEKLKEKKIMATPFIAEIKMFGGNFAPRGYSFCNGQLLSISQNTALFSLVGTTYGGNGTTTFGLPNLQGSAAMGQGNGPGLTPRSLGETGGTPTVTLNSTQLPSHNHTLGSSSGAGALPSPLNNNLGSGGRGRPAYYAAVTSGTTAMSPTGAAGSSGAHNNLQPYLSVTFIIALQGVYPARN
jgi:microcystin-dependent protein